MPLIPPNGIIAQAFGGVSPGQALDVGAITDDGGGATADGTIGAVTAPTALTVSDGTGTNDGTIGAITADASVIAAVQEIAAFCNAQRTATIALTDAIKELSTKVNLYRTYLRAAGLMA